MSAANIGRKENNNATETYWLLAIVLMGACQSSISQNAPAKTRAVKPPVSKCKAAPAYTAEGNKFTINLDEHGTSLAFEFLDQGFLRPHAGDHRMVSVFASFKTAGGCNSWFGKSAIFILDEISTITVPGAAHCPLPPANRVLPIWLFEQISSAQIVKMQLDDVLYDITPQQLSALKEFVDKRLLQVTGGRRMRLINLDPYRNRWHTAPRANAQQADHLARGKHLRFLLRSKSKTPHTSTTPSVRILREVFPMVANGNSGAAKRSG